jgi:hypothetical protein
VNRLTGRRLIVTLCAAGLALALIFRAVNFAGNEPMDPASAPNEAAPRETEVATAAEAAVKPAATSVTVEFFSPPLPQRDLPADATASREIENERPIGWPTIAEAEDRFALQIRDPAWADSAESGIVGLLSQIPDIGLMTIEVECRKSLCRLRLLFPSGAHTTYALRQIHRLSKSAGLGPVASDTGREADGLPLLRVFLRRLPG